MVRSAVEDDMFEHINNTRSSYALAEGINNYRNKKFKSREQSSSRYSSSVHPRVRGGIRKRLPRRGDPHDYRYRLERFLAGERAASVAQSVSSFSTCIFILLIIYYKNNSLIPVVPLTEFLFSCQHLLAILHHYVLCQFS